MEKRALGIVLGVIAFMLVLNFVSADGTFLSSSELSAGYSAELYTGYVVGFDFNGLRHTLLILKVETTNATIKFSNLASVLLNLGEEKKFDLNKDNIMDISVKLDNMTGKNKAYFTIKTISETASSPVVDVPIVEKVVVESNVTSIVANNTEKVAVESNVTNIVVNNTEVIAEANVQEVTEVNNSTPLLKETSKPILIWPWLVSGVLFIGGIFLIFKLTFKKHNYPSF